MVEIATFRATDGYEFYYRHYPAQSSARGRIVFVHGIRSHGGWYERSCKELAEVGFEVFFLDRRGAGLNSSRRGDSPEFRRLLDDVIEFIREVRSSKPWLPVALAGISWGGKLAAALSYRAPGLVSAVALLCPGLCPKVQPELMERVSIARARVRNPTKLFSIPLNEPELFTSSEKWQGFIREDRYGLERATSRFLASSVSFDIYLRRAVKRLTAPVLLMLAEEDRIIENAATRKFFVTFGCRDRTIIEYAGAHHTLEFEPSGHPFVLDLAHWLRKKLP